MADREPRATVVIVNWNGAHLLPACLDAVHAQDVDDFETWVVDNASSDGSVDLLRRDYPWVRVIENSANLGFAGGNNIALREARTPYVVLLNNDAIPEPSWLRETLAAFDDDRVGAVTPKILFASRYARVTIETEGFAPGGADPRDLGVRMYGIAVDGVDVTSEVLWEKATWGLESTFRWTRPAAELLVPAGATPATLSFTWAAERGKDVTVNGVVLSVGIEVGTAETKLPARTALVDVVNNAGGIVTVEGYGADRGFQEVDQGQYDDACEVFTFCGNGVAMRREVLEVVGHFDDDFFLYYEDTDLAWRFRSAGWAVRYEPRAVLRHHHASSTGESSPVFQFHVARNRLLMLTKNARARLWLGALWADVRATGLMGLSALRGRNRARLSLVRLRLQALRSYARLLPRMLARRGAIRRRAVVTRKELERWLVTR